jgi:RNA polymerase sigma-70 factor (ECF subfamily)
MDVLDKSTQGGGDPQWFAVELMKAQSAMYAYASTLMAGSSDAWDVLQEANLVMWRKASELNSAAGFLPWAYTAVRYQVMAYRKRVSRDRHVFNLGVLETLSERAAVQFVDFEDQVVALEDCMKKLSEQQHECLVLRYVEGLAVHEIARQLNRGENAIAATLYRARLALAQCVEGKMTNRDEP